MSTHPDYTHRSHYSPGRLQVYRYDANLCSADDARVHHFLCRRFCLLWHCRYLSRPQLLSILLVGFYQGMYALDAADGVTDKGGIVMHSLLQALLQAPDFNATEGYVIVFINSESC